MESFLYSPSKVCTILFTADISDEHSVTDDGQWGADIFNGHAIGCNSVSWAPATQPGSLIHPQQSGAQPSAPFKRFASAGCDNLVKIWGYREDTQSWVEEETLDGHTDWVRDVAWAPNIGLPRSYIATASQVRQSSFAGFFCLKISSFQG
jgi:protein transport protein SEC13